MPTCACCLARALQVAAGCRLAETDADRVRGNWTCSAHLRLAARLQCSGLLRELNPAALRAAVAVLEPSLKQRHLLHRGATLRDELPDPRRETFLVKRGADRRRIVLGRGVPRGEGGTSCRLRCLEPFNLLEKLAAADPRAARLLLQTRTLSAARFQLLCALLAVG